MAGDTGGSASGRLVVLNRAGLAGKTFPLAAGAATVGRAPSCDVRVLLSAVAPHHATLLVHRSQVLIRNEGEGETLVNGGAVSVSALQHNDVISVGGRRLRWEYDEPGAPRPLRAEPALYKPARQARTVRRATAAAPSDAERPVHRSLLQHRASMPGNAGGKQVAIVQPQRRDTSEHIDTKARSTPNSPRAQNRSRGRLEPGPRPGHKCPPDTTQATLWIESRKPSPRKTASPVIPPVERKPSPRKSTTASPRTPPCPRSGARRAASAKRGTPLRMLVLRKARSAQKVKVTKIEAPLKVDHMKQAALLLMTGRTPRAPLRRAPPAGREAVSVVEIADTTSGQDSTLTPSDLSVSSGSTAAGSPLLPSPKKSSLKDPKAKRSSRKTESIKFDLSNLENYSSQDEDDVLMVTGRSSAGDSSRLSGCGLRARALLRPQGSPLTSAERGPLSAPESPAARKSLRASAMIQKALQTPDDASRHSRRSTRTLTDQSLDATAESAFRTRTLSPRSARDLESYSIVDLVSSRDSDDACDASASLYGSAGSSRASSALFGTPRAGASTPYAPRPRPRRAASFTTPDNSEETQKHISINSTRISRAGKSRSRLNDSDLRLAGAGDSPRTSRRSASANLSHAINDLSPKKSSPSLLGRTSSPIISSPKKPSPRTSSPKWPSPRTNSKQASPRAGAARGSRSARASDATYASSEEDGTITPENVTSPQEQGTPVLSIQTLLNSSQSSLASHKMSGTNASKNLKRKTIGTIRSNKKGRQSNPKSKSFTAFARRSLRSLRLNSRESDRASGSILSNEEENVTPKGGGVKLVQEAVKNKHSTAKKPNSKRSIIDNLDRSDIVKQLFSSPVKRKLSQSMMEFSRKKLFDEDEEGRRPTRSTIALGAHSPAFSELEHTVRFSPDQFVSPLSTPGASPDLAGVRRLYTRTTPTNDLSDVKGVKGLLRSPHPRKSVKNDLTNVSGVKSLFRVQKEKASPENDLGDVRGVKKLFTRKSAADDLRNVSGVKRTLAKSPKNDLTDVQGVKEIFRHNRSRKDDSHDLSGVEELFNESNMSSTSQRNSEILFDQLIGRPPVKAVYSKSFVTRQPQKGKKPRRASLDLINNVERWLERELQRHVHSGRSSTQRVARALQQLATDTVQGTEAVLRTSRVRNSALNKSPFNDKKKSASETYDTYTLPIKKRSLVGAREAGLPLKKRALHSTPDGAPHSTPVGAPHSTPGGAPHSTPGGAPHSTPGAAPHSTPGGAPHSTPGAAPHSTPGAAPHSTPGGAAHALEAGFASPIATASDANRYKPAKTSPKDKSKWSSKAKVVVLAPEIQMTDSPKVQVSSKPSKSTTKVQANEDAKASEVRAIDQSQSPRQKRGARSKRAAEPRAAPHSPAPEGRTSPRRTRAAPTQRPARSSRRTDGTELANTRRRRNSLVITKKAPVVSPKVTKTRKDTKTKKIEPESPKRSTRQAETVEKYKSLRKARAKLMISEPSPAPRAARARRRADTEPTQTTKKLKKVELPKSPEIAKPSPPKRGRSTVNKSQDVEPPAKGGRNATKNVTLEVSPKKTRGKNVSQESLPAPRSNRRTKPGIGPAATETNNRKRKSNENQSPVPAKVAKTTRGRKAAAESLVVTVSPRGKRVTSPLNRTNNTRGKKRSSAKAESPVRALRSTRAGRQLTAAQSPAKKRKPSPTKRDTSAKERAKPPPAKKEAAPVKNAKRLPAKKVIASPVKKMKASPAKKVKASPAKKRKESPVRKVTPAKKVEAFSAKKTRGGKKVASPPASKRQQREAASPAKAVKSTRSRRR